MRFLTTPVIGSLRAFSKEAGWLDSCGRVIMGDAFRPVARRAEVDVSGENARSLDAASGHDAPAGGVRSANHIDAGTWAAKFCACVILCACAIQGLRSGVRYDLEAGGQTPTGHDRSVSPGAARDGHNSTDG
jgi:hypothetical protein